MSKVKFERVLGVEIYNGVVDGYRLGAWIAHKAVGGTGGWEVSHAGTGMRLPIAFAGERKSLADAKGYVVALHEALGADVLAGAPFGKPPRGADAKAAIARMREVIEAHDDGRAVAAPGPIEAAVVAAAQEIAPFDVVAFAERLVEAGVASTKMATMLVGTFTNGAFGRKGRVIAPAGDLDAAIARSLGNLGEATKRARAVSEARAAFGLAA